MFDQPYLETCCRAALHRLFLAGNTGRSAARMDSPCLDRLVGMGLVCAGAGGFVLTAAGAARHATEILKRPA